MAYLPSYQYLPPVLVRCTVIRMAVSVRFLRQNQLCCLTAASGWPWSCGSRQEPLCAQYSMCCFISGVQAVGCSCVNRCAALVCCVGCQRQQLPDEGPAEEAGTTRPAGGPTQDTGTQQPPFSAATILSSPPNSQLEGHCWLYVQLPAPCAASPTSNGLPGHEGTT